MTSEAPTPIPRRQFLRSIAATGAVGAAALSGCASTKGSVRDGGPLVPAGARVLFQGDSITDTARSRETADQPNLQSTLGQGYAWMAASAMLVGRPDDELVVFNRGISGNKVHQLADRWDADCLDLRPDVVSILIGVNDIWHARNGNYDGTAEVYERDYGALLARTRAALPDVKLVVCEPFVLRCGAVDDSWFPEFDTYRAACLRVAAAHADVFVPFHTMFEEATRYAPPEHWAGDGVHPSAAGAALMASTWLRATGSA